MNDSGFRHIAVTAADEDDVVITAGLQSGEIGGQDTLSDTVPERDEAPFEMPEEVPADSIADDGGPEGRAVAERAERSASRPSKKADAYHETTLEDLEPAPMPMTQKVVIIAAVVCIIGALLYCFVFMR